ncbi:hypothetical protein K1T71_004189 [Dendrolimus kikuchii]|uniref:Uncharacterized protein n=1 Tax=Dendrolimus kikuchii TaxID=765133 RepID=A0ACC1DAC7_9NEOP|nr:hypothetical protein K1T71_004189 [Dendrolimus kikuchii]
MGSRKENVSNEKLKELCPDLPSGPLDKFRKSASFDWRRMKLVYETVNTIEFKNKIWDFMQNHPLFHHSEAALSLDQERHLTTKRMYTIYNEQFLPVEKIVEDPRLFPAESEAMFMFDSSLAVKVSLTFRMFTNVIQGSGRAHHYHYIEDAAKGKIGGCFALTEVSHGSNAKGMRATATYMPEKKQFVLHTADFEAAKCWVGSLGKCATHAIVYAKLISKGQNHGLHAFVVPIRDPKTLKPYPGVVVGDLGEKIGLNGVDNGFVMFHNYHLPKDALLDKLGGVDENGDYKTPFRDPNKRFGASLGILSGGRVHITAITSYYLVKAIVIAIRYSAVRKQFGPENAAEETPVLEYQQQVIACFVEFVFVGWLSCNNIYMLVRELHALSSAVKPISGWTSRDGIQNCRECCGGHGYLKASAIGDLRNDNDANCTYEGENSLLLQQASNWLINVWSRREALRPEDSPLGSLKFLEGADLTLKDKCQWRTIQETILPENLIYAYKWLTTYILKMTCDKVNKLKAEGKDGFQAKNDSQSYNAVTLSIVYGENFVLNHFYKTALEFDDLACRNVLLKLVSLYGAFILEKHLATLYIGGFFSGEQGLLLREGILQLCAQLTPEAVALVDTLAPPDYCLRSVLGRSDGEAYKHIQNNVMTYPGSLSRPEWWRDVVFWQSYAPSKL